MLVGKKTQSTLDYNRGWTDTESQIQVEVDDMILVDVIPGSGLDTHGGSELWDGLCLIHKFFTKDVLTYLLEMNIRRNSLEGYRK